ncbi:hypothetical protein L7F22_056344 [Adiantum nelumboides]|nr:hypothetical protein [Adiantum nelumboides]
MDALYGNETWNLVPLPKVKKPIGCRWVYKVKHDSDESVSRYKAILVAKGYAQTYGIDYEETFALVSKMVTVRSVIAVAAAKGWILHQMDVKNAFLHADLQEEVYNGSHQDLGELRYILGIEMIRSEGGIWLSQKKYGLDMIMKYGMADCKPIFTPLDQNLKLRIDEGEVLDDAAMYCKIVGSLIYMTISWLDLSYAVGWVQDQIVIYCDNLSSIQLAWNPVSHVRTKHIEVHYHFIKERVLDNDIDLAYIGTEDQPADLFTKALGTEKLRRFKGMLGLRDMALSLRGSVEISSSMHT